MGDYEVSRIKTGINGLNNILEGGYPYPSTIVVAGTPGSGKTTYGMQFLFEGAKKGDVGLYITTLSEPTQWMLRFCSRYEFIDREQLGKNVNYFDLGSSLKKAGTYEDLIAVINDKITELTPQRIVIDPITVISHIFKEDYRLFLFDLCMELKNWQTTSLLMAETDGKFRDIMQESFTADGVIFLYNIDDGAAGRKRYLEVLKMRGTAHGTGRNIADLS